MVGAVAQLGEHLLCKQGVSGSIPLSSTKSCPDAVALFERTLRTDRPTMADGLWPVFGGSLLAAKKISFEEIKVLHRLMAGACSAYIVKRRLIWRLPGVVGCYP